MVSLCRGEFIDREASMKFLMVRLKEKRCDQVRHSLLAVLIPFLLSSCSQGIPGSAPDLEENMVETISLSEPSVEGTLSLEECIKGRRSTRQFTDSPLDLEQISQLLWAAQCITDLSGHRATPSEGAH